MDGTAAAQIPNAPSMWTQAPRSCAIGISSANGSNAPVFTLPAWVHTMVGPSIVASASRNASARIRPWSSDAILWRCSPARPRPEHLERGVDRDVGPRMGDDGHRRGALETEPLDIPADPRQHPVPCGGEGREVGHRGAGDEADARRRRAARAARPATRPRPPRPRRPPARGHTGRRSGPRPTPASPHPAPPAGCRRPRTRSSAARRSPPAPAPRRRRVPRRRPAGRSGHRAAARPARRAAPRGRPGRRPAASRASPGTPPRVPWNATGASRGPPWLSPLVLDRPGRDRSGR